MTGKAHGAARRMRRLLLALMALFVAGGQAFAQNDAPLVADPVPSRAELLNEAFVAAQYAQISSAAAALDRVTARFTAGSDGLAVLEQERDALVVQLAAIDERLTSIVGESGAIDEEQRLALTAQRRETSAALDAVEARMAEEFPQYFELTRPRPLAVAETQALLNDDEAMLLVLVADDASYIWGLTRDRATWARAEGLADSALSTKVRALRASMQVDPVDEETAMAALAFDRKAAHALYLELIAPVEDVIGEKPVLLTHVTGALTSLPLGLLLTAPPEGSDMSADDVAASPWLADRYALAELPSVSSLRALRCLLIGSKADAHPGCARVAVSSRHARRSGGDIVLAGFGAPQLIGGQGGTRAIRPELAGEIYNGALADTEKLRQMAYLPQAKIELENLQTAFGSEAAIVIGEQATESSVKQSANLSRAPFLIFATHGLLASEIGSNAEPGLVFTPPPAAERSMLDDGLLTASEAAQLDIAAELVVLSACNTAAGDGKPGADGLSGLARAFFFAGARSMLVSHWSVSDDATSMLMQTLFEELRGEDIANRARAMQTAMQTVRDNLDYDYTSPRFWAPFTLVGVPGQ